MGNSNVHPLLALLEQDRRYKLEAYQFVRDALDYAQSVIQMPTQDTGESHPGVERHITGQQLCEAIRLYAVDQFGFLAKAVLNSWGVYNTGDFGEIVYNLIRIKQMKKSKTDRREDFDDVYPFEGAFEPDFAIEDDECPF
jgi:uncharacterized repeat protein (TIGR04138 family)